MEVKIDNSIVPIPGLLGYGAKKDGTIWSQRVSGKLTGIWKKLSPRVDKSTGYRKLQLAILGGKKRAKYVHILILTTFIGPCPQGMQGCHNNGNKEDCSLDNLRWDTLSGNQADRLKHGTSNRGERSGMAVITNETATEIKRLLKLGVGPSVIARMLGIKKYIVAAIKANRSWKWLAA